MPGNDIVALARNRLEDRGRTHWKGCESAHPECLIHRLVDELHQLRSLVNDIDAPKVRTAELQAKNGRNFDLASGGRWISEKNWRALVSAANP